MQNKYDLVAFGEALIDFTCIDDCMYKANPGGAPFNLAVCAAKGGAKTAFIGNVGADSFGDMLLSVAEENGVDTACLTRDLRHATTHAFVTVNATGENEFVFCRDHCADAAISLDEKQQALVRSAGVFHFGGLSLATEPCRSTLFSLLKLASACGCDISFDPNYRPFLWKNAKSFVDACHSLPIKPALLKVSYDEACIISGKTELDAAMDALTEYAGIVLITMGSKGAVYGRGAMRGKAAGRKANVKDTTGAGDIFFGSFIAGTAALGKKISALTDEEIGLLTDKACAIAAKSTEKVGAIPSIPEISF